MVEIKKEDNMRRNSKTLFAHESRRSKLIAMKRGKGHMLKGLMEGKKFLDERNKKRYI